MQVSAHLPVHRYIASLLAAFARHPDLSPEDLEAWRRWAEGPELAAPDAVNNPGTDQPQPLTLATLAVRPLQIQAWLAQVNYVCPATVLGAAWAERSHTRQNVLMCPTVSRVFRLLSVVVKDPDKRHLTDKSAHGVA